jgi:DNA-binding MarR family transcriptional regulator
LSDAKAGMPVPRPVAASQAPSTEPKGPPPAGSSLLFLREEEIRLAQDLLFFAYRDFTNAADVLLAELGLGRAHHRALHFIGRNPGIPVSDLLAILRITKQSLARVLAALIEQGYVAQTPGRSDRRQRLLSLTPQGQTLERRLFERQRERIVAAYRDAGGPSVEGFRRVMRGIMDETARTYIDRAEAAANPNRARIGEAPPGRERRLRPA